MTKPHKAIILDYSYRNNFTDLDFENLCSLLAEVSYLFDNHLFIILDNIVFKQFPLAMHVADEVEKNNLFIIDEWIWLTNQEATKPYFQIFKSILWIGKNKDYVFNKDFLRVEHIWKDVEWGKREKNYHPLGKDPGNIWIIEKSNKGTITEQLFIPFSQVLATLIYSQVTTNHENFVIYSHKNIEISEITALVLEKTGFEVIITNKNINN